MIFERRQHHASDPLAARVQRAHHRSCNTIANNYMGNVSNVNEDNSP
jgi:hypothetical protein